MNDEFVRYVGCLKPREEIMKLYNKILLSMREKGSADMKKQVKQLEERMQIFEARKKRVKEDYWDGNLTKEEYNEHINSIEEDINNLQKQIEGVLTSVRTNLNPKLEYSICLINNLDKYFEDAPIEIKQRLFSSMFPEKVEFDGKSFRTTKYNAVLDLIYKETNQLRENKKGQAN